MDGQDRAPGTVWVADFESSDLTQREFALDRGVSFGNLRNSVNKLRKETRPLVCGRVAGTTPISSPIPGSSGNCPRLHGKAVTLRGPQQAAAGRRRDEVGPGRQGPSYSG